MNKNKFVVPTTCNINKENIHTYICLLLCKSIKEHARFNMYLTWKPLLEHSVYKIMTSKLKLTR